MNICNLYELSNSYEILKQIPGLFLDERAKIPPLSIHDFEKNVEFISLEHTTSTEPEIIAGINLNELVTKKEEMISDVVAKNEDISDVVMAAGSSPVPAVAPNSPLKKSS